ncbi:MAG: sigma-54 dependent transcriptional regulator [Planctomycetota bacterium]
MTITEEKATAVMPGEKILVVDDSEGTRNLCSKILEKEGYAVQTAENGEEALKLVNENSFDLIVTDLMMPVMDGMELLEQVKKSNPRMPVIIITAYASVATAVEAIKKGAYDYVPKPFNPGELQVTIEKALERLHLVEENIKLKEQLKDKYHFENIIGNSGPMQDIYKLVDKAARSNSNVVVYGESGTGKELIARAIHYNSARAEKPFVAVSCGAIPETLLESELFGYVKGAFTGAAADKKGQFEVANNGTLFLDEIGDIPATIQVKLLRVLQEREFTRVGGIKSIKVDIRLISATNRDLASEVENGGFRQDLYYRLHVVPIYLPPLRDRKEDVSPLAEHFLKKYCKENKKGIKGFSPDVMNQLMAYNWPGNVRELENIVQRIVTFEESDTATSDSLPPNFRQQVEYHERLYKDGVENLEELVEEVEKQHIVRMLRETRGRRTDTAGRLGIDRRTLYGKIKKYGITADMFKE